MTAISKLQQNVNVDILLFNLKKKLNLSDKEIEELSSETAIEIPVSIFCRELGMLESISVYLHDDLNLQFTVISRLLSRNYQTIYTSYRKGKMKLQHL